MRISLHKLTWRLVAPVAQICNLLYRRIAFGSAPATEDAPDGVSAVPIENRRYGAARQCNQSFGVRRQAKRHAALAALTNIPKAVSRFACHRTPKSSWSATIFADTYRLQICARGQKQAALTVMELLVSVAVMTVIVFGLYSMFAYTQNALRVNVTQVDVFDSGRAATDMISRELEELAACRLGGRANIQAVRTGEPLVQTDLDNKTPLRTNVLQEVFFLTQSTNRWTGIGYRVVAVDGIGTLYRFAVTANSQQLVANDPYVTFQFAGADPKRRLVSTNLHRVTDGVVHFRVIPYDSFGRKLDVDEPRGFTNFFRQLLAPGQIRPTNSPAAVFLRPDEAGRQRSQTEFFFMSNALPAYVELELGVLERTTFEQYLSVQGTELAKGFLRERANKVHLFRERVPIRTDVQ